MRFSVLLLGLVSACGAAEPAVVLPVALEPVDDASVEPSEAPVDPPAPALSLDSYALLWEAKTPGWNSALAFTPDGDVVAITRGTLTLHARHDGRELRKGALCESHLVKHGPLWVDERGFALGLCGDGLYEVRLEDMAGRRVHASEPSRYDDAPAMAAMSGDRIAIASRSGKVVVRDRKTFAVVAEHRLDGGGDLRAMAYAPDGSLAVSRRDQPPTLIRDGLVSAYETAPIEHGLFAFSADGTRAFVVPRYFQAGELILAEGLVRGASRISSWLTEAAYVTDTMVAATGAHGLALFDVAQASQRVLDNDAGEGLAVRADGGVICAAGRSGRLVCFGSARPEPSRVKPLAAPAKPDPAPAPGKSPAAAKSPMTTGTIESRHGSTLVLDLAGAGTTVGQRGQLEKQIDQTVGGMRITAWVTIADVTVTAVADDRVTVRIDTERSVVQVDGRKIDHFSPRSAIRLQLP